MMTNIDDAMTGIASICCPLNSVCGFVYSYICLLIQML